MKIVLSEYRPEWATDFLAEQFRLKQLLEPMPVEVEHIGSTAVPGLMAKPVVDIMAGVPSLDLFEVASGVAVLQEAGYEWMPEFAVMAPFRHLFTKTVESRQVNNLHLVAIDHPWWRRHLIFRGYLRSNEKALQKYSATKQMLSTLDWPDVNCYAQAKTEVILGLEEEAFEELNLTNEERVWLRSSRI